MALTYIAQASGVGAVSASYIDCSSTLNVQSGDVLVAAGCSWDSCTYTFSQDDGTTNTMDKLSQQGIASVLYDQISYNLNASASSAARFRCAFSSSQNYRGIIVFQFRPDAGDIVTLDAGPGNATGAGSSAVSANIDTTGISTILGFIYSEGGAVSSELIGEGAVSNSIGILPKGSTEELSGFYRQFTSAQSSIHSQATIDFANWLASIVAIKTVASASSQSFIGSGSISFSSGASTSGYNLRGRIPENASWPSYRRQPQYNISPQSYYLRKTPHDILDGGSEITSILQYGFFGPQEVIQTGVYTYSGSGNFTLLGTALNVITDSCLGSGNIVLSGSSNSFYGYLYSGFGNIGFTNSASIIQSFNYNSSGQINLLGNASCQLIQSYITSGQINLSGNASCQQSFNYNSSGQINLSGNAQCSLNAIYIYLGSGNTNFNGNAQYLFGYIYNGFGNINFNGSCESILIDSYNGSGGVNFYGSADNAFSLSYNGSGEFDFNGNANSVINLLCNGSGKIDFGGEAIVREGNNLYIYVASGEIDFGGNSNDVLTLSYSGSNGIVFDGNASVLQTNNFIGLGNIVYSGTAVVTYTSSLIGGVHLYNGIILACRLVPINSDIKIKVNNTIIGIPVTTATNNKSGAVRIKVNENINALQQI